MKNELVSDPFTKILLPGESLDSLLQRVQVNEFQTL